MFYQKLGSGNLKIDNVGNKIRKFVFPEEITDDEDIFTPEVKATENSELIIVEGYDDIKVRMKHNYGLKSITKTHSACHLCPPTA